MRFLKLLTRRRQQAVPKGKVVKSKTEQQRFKGISSPSSQSQSARDNSSSTAVGRKSRSCSRYRTSSNAETQDEWDEFSSVSKSEQGWKLFHKLYVDPVCHPDGFPLLHFFGKGSLEQSPYRPCKNVCAPHDVIAWENIFTAEYSKENDLTTEVTRLVRTEMEFEGYEFGIPGQTIVGDKTCYVGNNRSDEIVISQRENPIAIIEIGMNNATWWGKVGQGIKYVKMLCLEKWKKFPFTKSILLIVLTYDSTKKFARLGVFLCWKVQDSVRTSLLWRTESKTCSDLAIAFTTALNGVRNLVALHRKNFTDENFAVLGPSCCRFTSTNGELVSLF